MSTGYKGLAGCSIAMTQNLCTEQDNEKKVLNGGICYFVGTAIQWTSEHLFVSITHSKPYSNSNNALV